MFSEEIFVKRNTLIPNSISHSESEKLLEPSFVVNSTLSHQNFRRRSIKLRNINFNQQNNENNKQAKTHRQQHSPHNLLELKFLAEIIKKKQDSISIKQLEQINSKKVGKDYQYYDMIVRDLISEIKNRSSRDVTSSPQQTQTQTKFYRHESLRGSPQKKKEAVYGQIKLNGPRQKMVFSLSLSGSDTVYERKITSYIEFLYKLNFANRMYIDLSLSKPKAVYKIRVGSGNNGMLIKSLLRRRFWLQITHGSDFSFSWTQQTNSDIHQQQNVNSHSQIKTRLKPPNRLRLLRNSSEQDQSKIMYRQQIGVANEWYERSDCGKVSCFAQAEVGKVSNHIPINCIIGAKRILFKVMFWYYSEILEVDPFTILPKTYSFQDSNYQVGIKSFLENSQKASKVWIVKPGQNTNRGNGIKIVYTSQLINILNRQRARGPELFRPLIVQQYIKPFLYNGRKFDIRHYLLITSHNGYIRGYWYKQGYIRTSSQKYDIEDMDEMIHLTNDAIQKKGDRYGKYEIANKLSYNQFQRYLDTTFPHKHYQFETQILEKMKEITTHLLRASFQFMDPLRKKHNFELYGLDFYISSKFKPYLIECNANPCLQINCPILERIIPGAVQHALRIGLDPLFPPPQHYPTAARYQLCDRILEKLKYQLIFDQKLEGKAIRQKTSKCSKKLDLGGIMLKPQEDEFEDQGQQLCQQIAID